MKILKVSKEKKSYTVEFESGDKLTVSEDLIVQFRLIKDKELTEEEMNELKVKVGYDRGLQQALNFISFQLRSEKEVDRYLKEREFIANDRKKIIDRLKELTVLDDLFFAQSYVRTQLALSDRGPKQVQQKLKEKGISDHIIQQALTIYTNEEELRMASQIALKLSKRIRNKSFREKVQKIRLGLIQKGYQAVIIDQTMAALEMEQNEEEESLALEKAGLLLLRKNQRLPFSKRKQKVKQALYVKGFDLDLIQEFIDKECTDDTE